MQFTKWQGLGNDFILIEPSPDLPEERLPAFARQVCDRHFGVGGDGLVLVSRVTGSPLRMRIFNADGSEPEMCGNAIRCVARYAYERGLVKETSFQVKTKAGIKVPELLLQGGGVVAVRVDMGEPGLTGEVIPVAGYNGSRVIEEELTVNGQCLKFTAVSMGNPHCLLFVPEVTGAPVQSLGPALEHHPLFPNQTNVEFIEVKTPQAINLRVWERGVGETLACGTGTCAAVVGGVLTGRLDRRVEVKLPGGRLQVEWAANNHVYLTGPAQQVFEGKLDTNFLNHQRS